MTGFSDIAQAPAAAAISLPQRLLALARDRSEAGTARRLAATAFSARLLNAGLGFVTQILLARWMGEREYGVYAYLWVWLLVAGGIFSLGLPVAALKFVPDYGARGDLAGLRGFLSSARTLGLLPAIVGSALAAAAIWMWGSGDAAIYGPVAIVTFVILPLYVLTDIQTGIARAYDFVDLGLAADYLFRPVLLLVFVGIVVAIGAGGTAFNVMVATLAAVALTVLLQGASLQGRLRLLVPSGPRRFEVRRWAEVSWPLLTVTGFTLLLGATDIIVLKLFVGPEEIALYFAATKIVAIASFVSYGVANTSAHRFAAHVASGDRAAMAALAADTVRWTFWPTLAVAGVLAALGGPLLSLFGPSFAAGAPVVALLGLGLAVGAAVGPADRALAMADHGRATALIFGIAFLVNLVLALALIPLLGLAGAAVATVFAMAARAGMLFVAARRRLGLDMFVFAPDRTARSGEAAVPSDPELSAELLTPQGAGAIEAEWRRLAADSLEPNVFYSAEAGLAGMRHLPAERRARVLAVWRADGPARRLVGVLPLVAPRGRHLNVIPIRRAAEIYGTLSTPLVDPDRPEATLRAALRHLAGARLHGVLLPFFHTEGSVAAALRNVCERDGCPIVTMSEHRRAVLRSTLPGAEYIRTTLETRRRKEADRQRRRLTEEGALAFSVATDETAVATALDSFLALEAAGWKGRAGTDLRHAQGGEAFVRASGAGLAATGRFRIATLTLDGRVIAAGLIGIAGRRAFYQKTAYDESYARFSPGLLLTLDITVHLLDDPAIDDADSIAVADHPMIDRVWTERFPIASVLVATRPGGGALFRAAVLIETFRERAIAEVKARRAQFAVSRQPPVKDEGKKPRPDAPA